MKALDMQPRIQRMGTSVRRDANADGGQTLLEFALVAPLLLVFVLGLVDFGIAIDRRLVLDHAVREGARFASVSGNALQGDPADVNDVKAYTAAQAQGVVDGSAVGVCQDQAAGVIRVSISYTYDFVTGFTSMFNSNPGSIVLDPNATARIEQPLEGAVAPC